MRKALFRKYSLSHRSNENQQHIEGEEAFATTGQEPLKIEEDGEEDSFSRFLKDERTKMFTTGQGTVTAAPSHLNHSEEVQTVIVLDTPTVESRDIIGNGCEEGEQGQVNTITEVSVAEASAAEPPVPNTEKTNEWIRATEFARDLEDEFVIDSNEMLNDIETIGQPYQHQDSLEEYGEQPHDRNNNSVGAVKGGGGGLEEDRTLSDLLTQVAELDEIYSDHQIRRNMLIEKELACFDHSLPKMTSMEDDHMDVDELFDDAATYSSLQKAFKNPIDLMPELYSPPTPEANTYDAVEPLSILSNPPGPMIDVSPLKRENLEEEKLPPLPPKRKKPPTVGDSPSSNKENKGGEIVEGRLVLSDSESMGLGSNFTNSRRSSTKSLANRPPSQIIIMKSPDGGLTPPTKSLPPTPHLNHSKSNSTSKLNSTKGSTASLPKHKKPGFFTKLFSRRKSKSDMADSKSMDNINNRNGTVSPVQSPERSSDEEFLGPPMSAARFSNRSLKVPTPIHHRAGRPVGRSVSSVSGKRPNMTPDIVHIPLKGDSTNSLYDGISPFRSHHTSPRNISSYSIADDRKTMSALQLADLPLQDGNMELIAIADAQSLKNLCEGQYGVQLDPSVDLTEAEHYALYTSVAPRATASEFDETSAYYAPVEAGEILTAAEVATRLKHNF